MRKKKIAVAIPQIKTLAEADAHQRKHGFKPLTGFTVQQEPIELKRPKLRGEDRKRKMNQTEREFETLQLARKSRGEIVDFRFEGVRLGWGDCMVYKPDFTALRPDGRIELLEVKGAHIFTRDIVRFKGCRAEWKDFFIFEMHQRDANKTWNRLL